MKARQCQAEVTQLARIAAIRARTLRGFCADHLLESLGLEYGYDPEGDMERGMNRQCIARRRDGARCRGRYANGETKLCSHHGRFLDGGVRIALAQHDVDPGLLDMRTGYG
jgi:hypothetical protein